MAFGLIMLALTGLCAYFYMVYLKNGSSQPAVAGDRAARLAERAASLKAELAAKIPRSLSTCEEGTVVKLQDVGLEMTNIDGIIKGRNLLKQGPRRWTETIIDQGRRLYHVWSQSDTETEHFVSTESPSLHELGLNKRDFQTLHAGEPDSFTYLGSVWNKDSTFAGQFCQGGNELESTPCLVWRYNSQDGIHRIQLIRLDDSSIRASLQVRLAATQITLLTGPEN